MKPRTKRILSMAMIVGTLAIVLIIGISDNSLGDAWAAVRSLSFRYVVLAVATYVLYILLDAAAVYYFLRRQGYRVSPVKVAFSSIAQQYYSNITPGASGGQPMQIYYLHQEKVPTAVATSAICMRFFCFQVMLSIVCAVLWVRNAGFVEQQVGSIHWILVMGFVYNTVMVAGLATLALSSKAIKRLIAWGVRIGAKFHWIKKPEDQQKKLEEAVDTFHDSLMTYRNRPLDFAVQLLIGGLQLICLMSVIYIIYLGLGLHDHSYEQLVTMNVMEFISAAYAPMPGASGAQEGVFSIYFNGIFPDNLGLGAMLLWRFFTYYISLIIGVIALAIHGFRSGSSFREVSRENHALMEGEQLDEAEQP
ncbi:MAG: flippase-like domain-containing protein [Clostridia bacterium]|nr:flippase-like domain-containing protein [Clostridia bacterium]